MSSCNFFGNHGGQSMLMYSVKGGPTKVTIKQCTFVGNNYSNALVNLKMQAVVLLISNLNFIANTNKGGVIYLSFYSINFTIRITLT